MFVRFFPLGGSVAFFQKLIQNPRKDWCLDFYIFLKDYLTPFHFCMPFWPEHCGLWNMHLWFESLEANRILRIIPALMCKCAKQCHLEDVIHCETRSIMVSKWPPEVPEILYGWVCLLIARTFWHVYHFILVWPIGLCVNSIWSIKFVVSEFIFLNALVCYLRSCLLWCFIGNTRQAQK